MTESVRTRPPPSSYIPALDGIRGLAIAAVLVFHNYRVPGGWMGVDLFFALSGFLILRILSEARARAQATRLEGAARGFFASFYGRRAIRIFPAYYTTLILVGLIDPSISPSLWWYALYLSDFTFAAPNLAVPALHHTWSLAVEEQFYLIIPLLAWCLSPRRLCLVLAALLVVPTTLRIVALQQGWPSEFANYNIAARSDALLLGAILGVSATTSDATKWISLRVAKTVAALGLVAIVVLALTHNLSVSSKPNFITYTVSLLVVAFTCAAAVWTAYLSPSNSRIASALTFPPLRYLGRISYGVYLYHQVFLIYGERMAGDVSPITKRLLLPTLITALSIGFAALSWRFFEQPLDRLKDAWWPARRPAVPTPDPGHHMDGFRAA